MLAKWRETVSGDSSKQSFLSSQSVNLSKLHDKVGPEHLHSSSFLSYI
jgi:hypothetical protein